MLVGIPERGARALCPLCWHSAEVLLVLQRSGRGCPAIRRSRRRCSRPSSGRTPRRCRSRAAPRAGCRGAPSAAAPPAPVPASGSPRCRAGRSSRRCHRRDAASSWTGSPPHCKSSTSQCLSHRSRAHGPAASSWLLRLRKCHRAQPKIGYKPFCTTCSAPPSPTLQYLLNKLLFMEVFAQRYLKETHVKEFLFSLKRAEIMTHQIGFSSISLDWFFPSQHSYSLLGAKTSTLGKGQIHQVIQHTCHDTSVFGTGSYKALFAPPVTPQCKEKAGFNH